MAGDPSLSISVTISGIRGSTPICTKMNIQDENPNAPGIFLDNIIDVSDNDPNGRYSIKVYYNDSSLNVILYDSKGNEIARKNGITISS